MNAIAMGIDLAWSPRNASGLACLRLDLQKQTAELCDCKSATNDEEILGWIESNKTDAVIVGIDAPIIAPNGPRTSRCCDKEVSRRFGKYDAGAYPANRERCKRPVELSNKITAAGFSQNPFFTKKSLGCRQIEVFPHPAQITLFGLTKIIKYKKSKIENRRKGLQEFADKICEHLTRRIPRLVIPDAHIPIFNGIGALKGQSLKNREDQLDAILCAYIAANHWWWGWRGSEVISDYSAGYIVIPKAVVQSNSIECSVRSGRPLDEDSFDRTHSVKS